MKEFVKIPLERIAVIVGQDGEVKKFIEKKSSTSISIDSQTGDVEIDITDSIKGLRTKDVIDAIASGFSPEKAFLLFDDDLLMFETINLSSIAKTEKDLHRIQGRIIGSIGKTREIFESLTGVLMSVYEKTISLIGYPEQNHVARAGIDMLLKGSTQKIVYKFLEKKAHEPKKLQDENMKRLFELKEEHIKLLRNMNVRWDDCEFGAPSIDCKRPYGNSNVYNDIAKILGMEGTVIDDEVAFSQEQIDWMNMIHKETEVALQIVLVIGEFRPGEYVSDEYTDNWRLK